MCCYFIVKFNVSKGSKGNLKINIYYCRLKMRIIYS